MQDYICCLVSGQLNVNYRNRIETQLPRTPDTPAGFVSLYYGVDVLPSVLAAVHVF